MPFAAVSNMEAYSLVKGEEKLDSSESDSLTDIDLSLETKHMKNQHRRVLRVFQLLSSLLLVALVAVTVYAFRQRSMVLSDEICARRLSTPG